MEKTFHEKLKDKIDVFVHNVYDASIYFPKDEMFGATSQLRRAVLSIALNYTEGYARQRKLVLKNFLEISYGSLKETMYLIEFSQKRKYLDKDLEKQLLKQGDEISAMIWSILKKL